MDLFLFPWQQAYLPGNGPDIPYSISLRYRPLFIFDHSVSRFSLQTERETKEKSKGKGRYIPQSMVEGEQYSSVTTLTLISF